MKTFALQATAVILTGSAIGSYAAPWQAPQIAAMVAQQVVTQAPQAAGIPCPCTPAPNRATATISNSDGSINIGLCGIFDSTGFCDSYEGAGFGGGNWQALLIYQTPCFSPPALPEQAHGPRWWLQVWTVGGPGYWESWTPAGRTPPNFTDGTWTVH